MLTKGVTPPCNPIDLRLGRFKVEWRYQNEGQDGRYDPDDPTDVPYLRVTCWMQDPECINAFHQLEHGSYLTELPVSTSEDVLVQVGRRMIELLRRHWPHERLPTLEDGFPYRDSLRLLSHISPANFEIGLADVRWPVEALQEGAGSAASQLHSGKANK